MPGTIVLNFTVAGETQILSAISRFGEYASDLSEPYGEIAEDFKKVEGDVFAASGPGWAPLSEGYAAWKETHYPGMGILVRTGRLEASIQGGSDYVEDIGPLTLVLGTNVPYAIYHQKGTKTLPARRIIDITPETRTRWLKLIQKYLVEKAKEAR